MSKELIAVMCQMGKDGLERTFAAVPDDKLTWKPSPESRHALDLFGEVAQLIGFVAELLEARGQTTLQFSPALFPQWREERAQWTRAEAQTRFETNYSRFKGALELMSEEQLLVHPPMAMRNGQKAPLSVWVMMLVYRASVARFAQINYIQTQYGDTDVH